MTDSLGHASHARYDIRGNVLQTWDALGNTTDIDYNIADQVTQVLLPATGQTGTGRGKVVNTYLCVGGPTVRSHVYNENNVVIRQVNVARGSNGEDKGVSGSTETVTPEIGSGYHLSRLKDGKNQTTTYDVDEIGALRSVTYPGGDQVRFTRYDRSGNVTERIDGNGVVTQYVYNDVEDRLTDVLYPATPARNVHFVLGRLESKTDGEGSQSYTYGDSDEIVSVTTTYTGLPSKTLTYSYYPNGSRKETQTPVGSFSYNYDAAGRIVGLTNPFGETTAWDYLDNDWLWKQRQTSGITVNGTPTELERVYTYNALGQMTGLANGLGGAAISIFDGITHDGAGNRTSVTSALSNAANLGGTTSWAYDNKDRLTGETSTRYTGWSKVFGYDGAGNLTQFGSRFRTYNSNNQLTTAVETGNSFQYDGNGNPVVYFDSVPLTFDAENNLTGFNYTDNNDTFVAGYTSGGLRAWKQGNGGGRRYFLYDGIAPIIEMDTNGNTLATNTFGPAGLISRKATGSTTGSTFYTFDERGNTAQRLDASGSLLSSHAYEAYGNSVSLPSSVDDPFLFGGQAGYYTDSETGLVLCTFRYYDPSVGRWLTRDPAGYGGGMNLYAYCYGNPTNNLDPLGLSCSGGDDDDLSDADIGGMRGGQGSRPSMNGKGNSDWVKEAIAKLKRTLLESGINAALMGLGALGEAGVAAEEIVAAKTAAGKSSGTGFSVARNAFKVHGVSPDWAVKGAHITVDGVELGLRPNVNGGITFKPIFSGENATAVRNATAKAEQLLNNQKFLNTMLEHVQSAKSNVAQFTKNNGPARSGELHFLEAALKRQMGN